MEEKFGLRKRIHRLCIIKVEKEDTKNGKGVQ